MLARRFLYLVALLIVLAVGARLAWSFYPGAVLRAAMVPHAAFVPLPGEPDYRRAASWVARPDLPKDPTRFVPPGFARAAHPAVAAFYIEPTTSLDRTRWNASLDDRDSAGRVRLFAASQASAFNGVAAIWAPHYRQATIGAFLTDRADAAHALDFAYRDVSRAFDAFLDAIGPDRPFFLVGHSQGALHMTRLLATRIAGTPLQARVIAAYAVGWPISLSADLPRLGLPACARPDQTRCILSWMSFAADDADPSLLTERYDNSRGFTGAERRGTPTLCTNPLTGVPGTAPAVAAANIGGLVPRAGASGADFVRNLVGARCDARGLLLIDTPPHAFDPFVLPGHNYHVYDYALFWGNVRADAERRAAAFAAAR